MNKKIVHDALVLMAFSLILGGILGAVYQITLPAITQAEYDEAMADDPYSRIKTTNEVAGDTTITSYFNIYLWF